MIHYLRTLWRWLLRKPAPPIWAAIPGEHCTILLVRQVRRGWAKEVFYYGFDYDNPFPLAQRLMQHAFLPELSLTLSEARKLIELARWAAAEWKYKVDSSQAGAGIPSLPRPCPPL